MLRWIDHNVLSVALAQLQKLRVADRGLLPPLAPRPADPADRRGGPVDGSLQLQAVKQVLFGDAMGCHRSSVDLMRPGAAAGAAAGHKPPSDRPEQKKSTLEELIGPLLSRNQLEDPVLAVGACSTGQSLDKLQLPVTIHVFQAASAAGIVGEQLAALQECGVRR